MGFVRKGVITLLARANFRRTEIRKARLIVEYRSVAMGWLEPTFGVF